MRPSEKRVDVHVYFLPEEREHLKTVAEEQGISLSELIGSTVLKKYKLPKKKARSVNLASKNAKSETPEQVPLDAGQSQKEEVSPCDVRRSFDVPVIELPPQDADQQQEQERSQEQAKIKKQKEARLAEVNTIINRAKKGGPRLPFEKYHALIDEQTKLRAEVGHN